MNNNKALDRRKYGIHFSAYGGQYRNTRKGRSRPRPISCRHSMHLVLRSTRARGHWSFWRSHNNRRIEAILAKFSGRHGVRIISKANVGNHLHLHIRLFRISGYKRFIRAVTGAIAMAITGKSRWSHDLAFKQKFWDLRPFTRLVIGRRDFSNVKNYIRINQLEGLGYPRTAARAMADVERMLNSE
jgi:REP element-mobilizing transposase RayT